MKELFVYAPGIGRGLIRAPARYRTLSELNPATGKGKLTTEAQSHREKAIKKDLSCPCASVVNALLLHDFDLRFGP